MEDGVRQHSLGTTLNHFSMFLLCQVPHGQLSILGSTPSQPSLLSDTKYHTHQYGTHPCSGATDQDRIIPRSDMHLVILSKPLLSLCCSYPSNGFADSSPLAARAVVRSKYLKAVFVNPFSGIMTFSSLESSLGLGLGLGNIRCVIRSYKICGLAVPGQRPPPGRILSYFV